MKANGAGRGYARTVGMMIRNPAYKGVVVSAGGVITHRVVEPLVDAALWKRANDALDSDTRRRRGPNQVKALLAGVAKCGECGAAMYRTPAEKGRQSRYYRCKASHGVMVPLADLDSWVDQRMSRHGGFVLRETVIPGKSWDAELEAVAWELRELPRQGWTRTPRTRAGQSCAPSASD
jgi:Recombinase zinc beta ribbon domain